MNARREALPEGIPELGQACWTGGRLFAVAGTAAFRWSPDAGWEGAAEGSGPLKILGPVTEGMLFRAGERVGLWPVAAPGWAWWQAVPGMVGAYLADDRSLAVSHSNRLGCVFYVVGLGGLEAAWELHANDIWAFSFLGACRLSDGDLLILTSTQLMRVRDTQGSTNVVCRVPERWRPGGGGFAMDDFYVAGGEPPSPAAAFSLRAGYITILPLPSPTSGVVRHLLRAYIAGDRARAKALLRFLESVSVDRAAAIPLDFVLDGDDPIAVATSAGLAWPAGAVQAHHHSLAFDVLPWRLWLDPETTLPSAVAHFLGPPVQRVLGEALAQCRDDRLPRLAIESVRGRSTPIEAENVRTLFNSVARGAADVLSAMGDEDSSVALLGTLAAAAPRMAKRLDGPDLRPAFEARLRASLQASDSRLRLAALEFLAGNPRAGLATALGEALDDEDARVRSRAFHAVRDAPDRGSIVPAIAAAVHRETREDEILAGLQALADVFDPAADQVLVVAAGHSSGRVRREAEQRLATKAHRLSAAAARETLDHALLLAVAAGEARRNGLAVDEIAGGLPSLWSATRAGLAHAHVVDGGARFPPVLVLEAVARRLFPEDLKAVVEEDRGLAGDELAEAANGVLQPEDVRLLEDRAVVPPSEFLAELAERVQSVDMALADRLAVLALLGVGGRPPSAGTGLSARLRSAGPTSRVDFCRSWADALTDAPPPSALGRLAAFVLAVRGGASERRSLERRLFGGDLVSCPLMAMAYAAHLGRDRGADLARRIAQVRSWPAGGRSAMVIGIRHLLGLEDSAWPELADALGAQVTKDLEPGSPGGREGE